MLGICAAVIAIGCGGGDGPAGPSTTANIAGTWIGRRADGNGFVRIIPPSANCFPPNPCRADFDMTLTVSQTGRSLTGLATLSVVESTTSSGFAVGFTDTFDIEGNVDANTVNLCSVRGLYSWSGDVSGGVLSGRGRVTGQPEFDWRAVLR